MKKFKLIVLLLAFVLLFTPIFSSTVHATDYNGTDDESGQASGKYAGGPSYGRTGFLMYLVRNESDEVVSDVVAVSCGGAPQGVELLATRIGNMQPSRRFTGVQWASAVSPNGAPFDNLQHPNGAKIIAWMLQDDGAGTENWANVVTDYWGKEKALAMADEGYSLIMEPFYWANLGNGWVCANAKGWGQYMSAVYGSDSYGPSVFKRFTNGIFAHCAKFSAGKWTWGLSVYEGGTVLTNRDMEFYAVGIMSVTPHTKTQTTCDEGSLPAPHPAAVEAEGEKSIVKNYRTKNLTTGQVTDDGCFITEKVASSIVIEDESEYKVVEWKVSDTKSSISSITWPVPGSISQSGKNLGLVELKKPTEKVLYVLLEKEEKEEDEELLEGIDYIIEQSQVSKMVHISEAKTNESAKNIKSYQFIWDIPKLKDECSGHDYEDGTEEYDSNGDGIDDSTRPKYSTAYCEDWEIIDSEIQVGLKNSLRLDYPYILSDSWYKNPTNAGDTVELLDYDRGQDFSEHEFITDQWDEKLVIHRGKDKLSIAEWKSVGTELSGITSESDMYPIANTPQGRRKSADFTDTFDIELKNNSPDVETISAPKNDSGHGICDEDAKDATIESYLISPINVYIKTYSGSADGGTNNTDCATGKLTFSSGSRHISGVMVPTGTTISFYPYIWMRFDTLDDKDIQVDVLGQYRRSISPNDYAEVEWREGSYPNLTLSSKQWSTHALSTSGQDWRQADSVLPGGAIMNLGIKQSDRQVVTVRTYQTILIGPGLEQVEATGSGYEGLTEEAALSNHEATVAQVADSLDNLCVEQYVNTNWSSSPFNGQIVSSGCSLGSGFSAADKKASTEDKYYFREPGETLGEAQEGDLDVNIKTTSSEIYTFSTNELGQVLMNGSVIVDLGGSSAGLSGTAKEINDRTYIVDKILSAVEQGSGYDSESITIPQWYEECFDGISVIKCSTTLETGMIQPSERTAVLDVKLTPSNKGQSDLFSKAYSSQFKMKDTSSIQTEKEKVSDFCSILGFNTKSLYMDSMEDLYHSKIFYIPNVNTQDISR